MSITTTDTPSPTVSPSAPIFITEAVFYALMNEANERFANAEAANEILIAEVDSLNDRVTTLQEGKS